MASHMWGILCVSCVFVFCFMCECPCLCASGSRFLVDSIGGYYRQSQCPSRVEVRNLRVGVRIMSLVVRRVNQFDDY